MAEVPFERFDPAVRSLAQIERYLEQAVNLALEFTPDRNRHEGDLPRIRLAEELMAAADLIVTFVDDCQPANVIATGFEHLLDNFQYFVGDFHEVLRLIVEVESSNKPASNNAMVATGLAKMELAKLERIISTSSPTHIELQRHFEFFITYGAAHRLPVTTRERLVGPVAALRDDYFLNPQAGLLESYLKLVAEALADRKAREEIPAPVVVNGTWLRQFSKATEELEILSMLEFLDPTEATAVVHG
jgi:hypothetical protein